MTRISIGPILFNWSPERWRDFYFRIADESPVARVYIGEVICSKRTPFFEPHYAEVAERLERSGKEVVFSTLSEVMIVRERKIVESFCADDAHLVEANDASALYHLRGRAFAAGPFLNVYNEDALDYLAGLGMTHVTLPPELPATAMAVMAGAAAQRRMTTEVMVYGRAPLALSARCYHARAHGRVKDNCQFVCDRDPDGMDLKTLGDESLLSVNGVQTLSHGCLNLAGEVAQMQAMGIDFLRLSPQSGDMVKIAAAYDSLLRGACSAADVVAICRKHGLDAPFVNGFFHGRPGHEWLVSAA